MTKEMQSMFDAAQVAPDTEEGRTCGCCGTFLPWSSFYKDGVDSNGDTKYRRDCKQCYKTTRTRAKNLKRQTAKRTKK